MHYVIALVRYMKSTQTPLWDILVQEHSDQE